MYRLSAYGPNRTAIHWYYVRLIHATEGARTSRRSPIVWRQCWWMRSTAVLTHWMYHEFTETQCVFMAVTPVTLVFVPQAMDRSGSRR